jgi:hypothetical protein
MQAPDAPVPVTGGAAGDFTWIADDGAASYTLQYAFNSDFSDAVTIRGLTHNEAAIGLEGLEYGTWYWRVAATDEAGNTGDWSDVSTFVVVPPNYPPVADAGENQAVKENAVFTLDASNSSDDKGIVSYTWTQTAGTAVLPEDPLVTTAATVELTAPAVGPLNETLVFELVVSDASDETASAATTVTVTNVITGSLLINDGAYITGDRSVTLSLDAPEAIEMRFANDSESFEGDFIPYSENALWTMGGYDASIPENIKTVRVEFRDEGGNTAVVSDTIRLDMIPPEIPLINGDSAGGYFEWDPIAAATGYNLQYSFNSDFSDAVTLTNIRRTNAFVTLDGIENFGTCYWRVQTIDAAKNLSSWSEVASFNVAANCAVIVPAVPQLAWPLHNAAEISKTVLLETGDIDYPTECGVHAYTEWQVSAEYDFGLLLLDVSTWNYKTMYQIPHLLLDPSTKYYWRAKHVADSGMESDWSMKSAFTTEAGEYSIGVDGVVLDGSTIIKRGSISIRLPVGDSGIKLNSLALVSENMVPLVVKDIDPATITDTENRPGGFPYGLFSYRIAVEPGGFAEFEVKFSDDAPFGGSEAVLTYTHEDGWHQNPNVTYVENGRLLNILWQDGGVGDADGIENGFIINP